MEILCDFIDIVDEVRLGFGAAYAVGLLVWTIWQGILNPSGRW